MEEYMREYEEIKTLSPFWGWVVLIVFSLGLISFGMISHFVIKESPRKWNFGALPIAPGESKYSTYEPSGGAVSQQMQTLPEALPLKKLSPDTSGTFSGECRK